MKKYQMPKGYKGHPVSTGSIDDGSQYGRKSANFVSEDYKPDAKKKQKEQSG